MFREKTKNEIQINQPISFRECIELVVGYDLNKNNITKKNFDNIIKTTDYPRKTFYYKNLYEKK